MLDEDQAFSLLERCERLLGHRLDGIRAQLHASASRSPALWELLVVDALSAVGTISYESPVGTGHRPDVTLTVDGYPPVCVEAKYVYGRFMDGERRAEHFRSRLRQELSRRRIPGRGISCRIDGEPAPGGFPKRLPAEHELRKVFAGERLRTFFDTIRQSPATPTRCDLRPEGYTVTLTYSPSGSSAGGGLVSEQPTNVEEHVLYRALVEKAKKAKRASVSCPYVVCVGSDQSSALAMPSGLTAASVRAATSEAFGEWTTLSGAIVVNIQARFEMFAGIRHEADVQLYENLSASCPLPAAVRDRLAVVRFDRWEYGSPHKPWSVGQTAPDPTRYRTPGDLSVQHEGLGTWTVRLPEWRLTDLLAGGPTLSSQLAFDGRNLFEANGMGAAQLASAWIEPDESGSGGAAVAALRFDIFAARSLPDTGGSSAAEREPTAVVAVDVVCDVLRESPTSSLDRQEREARFSEFLQARRNIEVLEVASSKRGGASRPVLLISYGAERDALFE